MSRRGDDKSIEPAHQPWPAANPQTHAGSVTWPCVPFSHIAEVLTEDRVRRIAEEVAAKIVADLERRVDEVIGGDMLAPPRETGWAIMDKDGLLLAVDGIFRSDLKPHEVRWLDREPVAEYMLDAHAVFLDKATLQQVQRPKPACDDKLRLDGSGHRAAQKPPRETGWAVVLEDGLVLVGRVSFALKKDARAKVHWLDTRVDAETLARLLGVGRAALLYKDTLEEVEA